MEKYDNTKTQDEEISEGMTVDMTENSTRSFLIGLKNYIRKNSQLTQEEFAVGICTPQYFSKLLNFKTPLTNEVF